MISADLGQQLESDVTQLLANGRYGSKSEVLREAGRLVEERAKRLAALDAAIARGLADVEAGRSYAVEEVVAELTLRFAATYASAT